MCTGGYVFVYPLTDEVFSLSYSFRSFCRASASPAAASFEKKSLGPAPGESCEDPQAKIAAVL